MQIRHVAAGTCALTLIASAAQAQVGINEIFGSEVGTDFNEFVELRGSPGQSLNGFMVLIVEGDSPVNGTLDRAYDLSALSIGPTGYFVLGNAAVSNDFLLGTQDSIENGTNTFYLVQTTNPAAITALVGTNIVVSGTTTQIPALSTITDSVAVVDGGFPAMDVVYDNALTLGPDGTFLPAGILRCNDFPKPWSTTEFLDFDNATAPAYPLDTPGSTNNTCTPVVGPGSSYCFGDGTLATACPCVAPNTVPNPPAATGHGCANSLNLDGAMLKASGTLSPDMLTFTVNVAPNYLGFGFLIKGNATDNNGIASSDGIRCASGQLVRFGGHNAGTNGNPAGQWIYPNTVQTISVSAATAQAPAQNAFYQLFYRNAAAGFCTAATANFSNGYQVAWP